MSQFPAHDEVLQHLVFQHKHLKSVKLFTGNFCYNFFYVN